MTRTFKRITLVTTATFAVAMGTVAPASAAAAGDLGQPNRVVAGTSPNSGTVVNAKGQTVGGWKVLDVSSTSQTSTDSTSRTSTDTYGKENVGGGIWEYGTYTVNNGGSVKHCWSKYYTIYNTHSATAVMNYTLKVYANAYSYADAHISVNAVDAQVCRVYWSN